MDTSQKGPELPKIRLLTDCQDSLNRPAWGAHDWHAYRHKFVPENPRCRGYLLLNYFVRTEGLK